MCDECMSRMAFFAFASISNPPNIRFVLTAGLVVEGAAGQVLLPAWAAA